MQYSVAKSCLVMGGEMHTVVACIKARGLMFEHKHTLTNKRMDIVAKQFSSERIWIIQSTSRQTACTEQKPFCCLITC